VRSRPATGGGLRDGRERLRAAAGWALLGTGVALMVLPGPGIPLFLAGLALLARDRPWARRLRVRLRARARRAVRRLRPARP
jgi:hypothetical protein